MNGTINNSRIAAILLAFLPLLDMYTFPFVINNLGTVIQLVLVLILCFTRNVYNEGLKDEMLNKFFFFLVFSVFALFVSMVANISYGFNGRKLISIAFILIILYHAKISKVDFSFFLSLYSKIAIACCIYAILQTLFAYCFNVYLPQNILPIETEDIFAADLVHAKTGLYRASSCFSEPASFAQYIIPALCLHMSSYQSKTDKILTIFLIAGIIVSTSSLGIFVCAIVWVITSCRRNGANLVKYIGGLIFFIIIVLIVLNVDSYISDSIGKILGGGVSGKTDDRVFRGIAVFSQIPLEYKFFGIGLGNAESIIKQYAISTIYDSTWYVTYDYFNSISSAFIFGGIFGGISFIMAFFVFLQNNDFVSKMLAFVFLVMGCASSFFFDTFFLFYGICLIATSRSLVGKVACFGRKSYE